MFKPVPKPVAESHTVTLSAAVPLETAAVPRVVLPTANVTVPLTVPAVVEFTDAIRLATPPTITELGVADTVTEVVGVCAAVTASGVVLVEDASLASPL